MTEMDRLAVASERLEDSGFLDRSLPSILDDYKRVVLDYGKKGSVRFAIPGHMQDARMNVYSILPYSTSVDDPSILVRLGAQQASVGDEYAVIGVEAYNSTHQKLPRKIRPEVRRGSFRYLAEQVFRVMEACNPRSEALSAIYGYSLGADVATEVAEENIGDENRGVTLISFLGVYDPARVIDRGRTNIGRALKTTSDFKNSGPALWQNVVASRSPALLEARNVTEVSVAGEAAHERKVTRDVIGGVRADPLGSIAISSGFGHNTTLRSLQSIASRGRSVPFATLGRMGNSTITPDFYSELGALPDGWFTQTYAGLDHSAADKLQNSAAFMMSTLRVS